MKKVKKGKNCVFWSFSDKKQFFPYCYNSVFGFHEKRSSNLIKDYFAKGLVLFNSDFYHQEKILKNYQSKVDCKRVFDSIYSNRSIRAITTYSEDLEKYESAKFLNFYFDNYGYNLVNSIIFQLLGNQLNVNININDENIFNLFCSEEKKSILNLSIIGSDNISNVDYLLSLTKKELKNNELTRKSKEDKLKEKCQIFYFESYPYWLNIHEIRKIEDYYVKNKDKIEYFNKPLNTLYDYYVNKFYLSKDNQKCEIVERYIKIQKTWIYLISIVKSRSCFVIVDGSFSDFKFFPLLSGFLPQKSSKDQIFDLYIFGDNLTFGMGKNIVIFNNEDNRLNDKLKIDNNIDLYFNIQPYFNPYGFEILFANLRRCLQQYHYSILLRYLYFIGVRKNVEVIGPYIYLKNNLFFNDSIIKEFERKEYIKSKPFTIPLKLPDEIFYFILRLLPDKKDN
ncbi:MAG: hypothetical protein ACK4YF_06590 [Exilispira sp.]